MKDINCERFLKCIPADQLRPIIILGAEAIVGEVSRPSYATLLGCGYLV
jgi:hypothetical protein